jgi:ribosomal protein S18 acetylase RimI-like enzyme
MSAHGLGPHVVGQRVVVRRLVPGETGPTGGPAFTDVLGELLSWADGRAVLRTESGTTVVIETALIVSGKPVPPRPSTRHRVGVREAESHAAPLWTGIEREPLGEWELRHEPHPSDRLRKRTNSALAIGDPGMHVLTAASAVAQYYADRGRPALAQVETGSEVEQALLGAGWTRVDGGDALFLLGSASRALRALGSRDPGALETDGPRFTATVPGAVGRAGLDGDWLGVHELQVDPALRRQGLAGRVLRTLLAAGTEQGALHLWLHVEVDNTAALRLYEKLGLTEHHACRYLTAPV